MDTILVILPKSKFGNVENVKVCGNRRLPEENENFEKNLQCFETILPEVFKNFCQILGFVKKYMLVKYQFNI